MASQIFDFEPTSGVGYSSVWVTTKDDNFTYDKRQARLLITNGITTLTVNLTQRCLPKITLFGGSTTVPASGGTLSYTVTTDYDFLFHSVPEFITIRDERGNTYTEDERIPASRATDNMFFFDFAENTTTSARTAGDMFMGHYIGASTLSERGYPITFSQEPSSGGTIVPYLYVNPSIAYLTYESASTTPIEISTNVNWSILNQDEYYFLVLPPTGTSGNTYINIASIYYNTTETFNRNGQIWIDTGLIVDGQPLKVRLPIVQGYLPQMVQISGTTTVPQTGGTLVYKIYTEYDFVFQNVPSYVTIRDDFGNTYRQGERIPASRATDNKFYVVVPRNESGVDRIVRNTFNMGHYLTTASTVANMVSYINFSQVAEHQIIIDACCDISANADEGWYSVNVESNGNWEVYQHPDWLTVSPEASTGNYEVIVHLQSNSSTIQRTGEIIFDTGDNTAIINVTQRGRTFGLTSNIEETEETNEEELTE